MLTRLRRRSPPASATDFANALAWIPTASGPTPEEKEKGSDVVTNEKLHRDLSQALLGAGIAIGLIADGLRHRIEPAALSDLERAEVYGAFEDVASVGNTLTQLGLKLREDQPALGTGSGAAST